MFRYYCFLVFLLCFCVQNFNCVEQRRNLRNDPRKNILAAKCRCSKQFIKDTPLSKLTRKIRALVPEPVDDTPPIAYGLKLCTTTSTAGVGELACACCEDPCQHGLCIATETYQCCPLV